MAFSSAEELLYQIEEQKTSFDLYLLDIFMGTMNGIKLGERIRRQDSHALICFLSSSADYYAEAFSLYAFQYLIKPIAAETFQKLLSKASDQISYNQERCLNLNRKNGYLSIPYNQILFVSSMGHTLFIHCKDGSIIRHNGRLNELAISLDSRIFARCHQSYIVNLYNVFALESDFFVCDKQHVPISRRYFAVKERYRALLFRDME